MLTCRITPDDAERAYQEWGANCGPAALAAIMGMTLDEVRPHLIGFDAKRYTNPAMMNEALRSIGRPWEKIGAQWPKYGLVRVQWEGPWTAPGVPIRARYCYTHWIGHEIGVNTCGVFDINAIGNCTGWCERGDWETVIIPAILAMYPRASGKWHITHAIEISRDGVDV